MLPDKFSIVYILEIRQYVVNMEVIEDELGQNLYYLSFTRIPVNLVYCSTEYKILYLEYFHFVQRNQHNFYFVQATNMNS